jgi:hypothetical protein
MPVGARKSFLAAMTTRLPIHTTRWIYIYIYIYKYIYAHTHMYAHTRVCGGGGGGRVDAWGRRTCTSTLNRGLDMHHNPKPSVEVHVVPKEGLEGLEGPKDIAEEIAGTRSQGRGSFHAI